MDGWGPKPLREAFPAEPGEAPLPLTGLDTVYYSYTDRTVYFMKDDEYWELSEYNVSTGPLARPFARGTVNDRMAILPVFSSVLDYSGRGGVAKGKENVIIDD